MSSAEMNRQPSNVIKKVPQRDKKKTREENFAEQEKPLLCSVVFYFLAAPIWVLVYD